MGTTIVFCVAASLISDAAAAFFKTDKEVHDILHRRRELYQEIERETAQQIFRYQNLAEERNVLLAKRKLARAKANEHTLFHVDETSLDWKILVEYLRAHEGGGKFSEEVFESILAVTEDKGFKLAKHIAAAATLPAGKTVATSNSFSSLGGMLYAEHLLFKPNPDDEIPEDKGDAPPSQRCPHAVVRQASRITRGSLQYGQLMQGVLGGSPSMLG